MPIGHRIKKLRLEHNLSQLELGKIAGVTDKAVSTWEQDIKTPRMGAIEKMAAYFRVTKGYIIDGESEGQGFESLRARHEKPHRKAIFGVSYAVFIFIRSS